MRTRTKLVESVALAGVGLGLAGCATNTGNGALIGGATGAGLGAIVGHQGHNTAGGALIGGAIGAMTGALIGNEVDREQRRQYYYYDDPYYYYYYYDHPGYYTEYRVWREDGPYGPGYYTVREYRY